MHTPIKKLKSITLRILESSHISSSSFPPHFIENYVVTWSFYDYIFYFFSQSYLLLKDHNKHYLMFIHFCFMYLLYHLYLIFLHLKYLIQDCFTSRYLCGKFLKACMAENFFLFEYLFYLNCLNDSLTKQKILDSNSWFSVFWKHYSIVLFPPVFWFLFMCPIFSFLKLILNFVIV